MKLFEIVMKSKLDDLEQVIEVDEDEDISTIQEAITFIEQAFKVQGYKELKYEILSAKVKVKK